MCMFAGYVCVCYMRHFQSKLGTTTAAAAATAAATTTATTTTATATATNSNNDNHNNVAAAAAAATTAAAATATTTTATAITIWYSSELYLAAILSTVLHAAVCHLAVLLLWYCSALGNTVLGGTAQEQLVFPS